MAVILFFALVIVLFILGVRVFLTVDDFVDDVVFFVEIAFCAAVLTALIRVLTGFDVTTLLTAVVTVLTVLLTVFLILLAVLVLLLLLVVLLLVLAAGSLREGPAVIVYLLTVLPEFALSMAVLLRL